jgi:ribosomal-protein-alanine N-acetyltransferase
VQDPDSPSFRGRDLETGAHQDNYLVAPVSHIWLRRLVEIDSSWNPQHWSERLFGEELANPIARVRGVFLGEQLLGYVLAHVVCEDAHIVSLGVAPDYRRQGAAEFLLSDLLRSLKFEGVKVITLDVRVSNLAAQGLYRKLGFSVVALRKHFYSGDGEDALTMRRGVY